MRLSEAFDPKANSLTVIRLVLAVGVIAWHAVMLADVELAWTVRQMLENGFVDGFFAISGFLIVASWVQRPSLLPFITARALRILPGCWVALAVTAFVIAPGALMLGTGSLPGAYWNSATSYFLTGVDLSIGQRGIAGTPSGMTTDAWNGSLWTLWWEGACYYIVAVFGLFGILRRRAMLVLYVGALALGVFIVAGVVPSHYFFSQTSRFILMFAAGGLLYLHRDRVPASWWGVVVAVPIVAVSALLPDYRLFGALPLAYALIVGGALVRRPAFRTDLSYGTYIYAFPIQVGLVMLGVTSPAMNGLVTLACVLPLAVGSWFVIERPALRLKTPLGELLEPASRRIARVMSRAGRFEQA